MRPPRRTQPEPEATVVRQDRGYVTVRFADGSTAVVDERFDRNGPVVVGDRVSINADGEVAAVSERRGALRRLDALGRDEQVLAANVDMVLVVAGLDRPVRAGRIHRSVAQAHDAEAESLVVISKADLVDDAEAVARQVAADHPGVDVLAASALRGDGMPELTRRIAGRTVVLLGESGAGKSSLLNALLGEEAATVRTVREADSKGRHTTTHRELFDLPGGGAVIDTPGLRALGLYADVDAVDATFPDIQELLGTCRFSDCSHRHEPGCQVSEAAGTGELDPARVEAWLSLREEAETGGGRSAERSRRNRRRPEADR